MDFSAALVEIKKGNAVARAGWNGKGMYVHLNPGDVAYDELPYLELYTADRKFVPWTISQTDALAEDWVVITLTTE